MSDTATTDPLDILIVGAGISGIGMGAQLARRCPDKTFAILERREQLGGTWDLFRYPGVRSDSDMFTLGYANEPWRDARAIADGSSIRDYLAEVAEKHGLTKRMRFGRKVVKAEWNSNAGLWTVTSEIGEGGSEQTRARWLYFGSGYYDYDDPHEADIPGIEAFAGEVIHPQHWPADFDYSGKRVVVIGSGATAATIVPAVAEKAAHVTMLQRTPTYYFTRPSTDGLANFLRKVLPEKTAYAISRFKQSRLHALGIARARSRPDKVADFLQAQVKDQLGERYEAEHFTPPYNPWDQRVCLIPDGDLFSAIREERASIVTDKIEAVDASGIALKTGERLEADVIVTATGLRLSMLGKATVSVDGETVEFPKHFYYRNCMISNVPNFAALFGYLNASWTQRVDLVTEWLCRLFNQMDHWKMDVATPVLPADHGLDEDDPRWGFSSGYLQRGRHLIPKSATTQPWRLTMDMLEDRRALKELPLDDGWLQFSRLAADAGRAA